MLHRNSAANNVTLRLNHMSWIITIQSVGVQQLLTVGLLKDWIHSQICQLLPSCVVNARWQVESPPSIHPRQPAISANTAHLIWQGKLTLKSATEAERFRRSQYYSWERQSREAITWFGQFVLAIYLEVLCVAVLFVRVQHLILSNKVRVSIRWY